MGRAEDADGMRDVDHRRRGRPRRGAPNTRRADELAFERLLWYSIALATFALALWLDRPVAAAG